MIVQAARPFEDADRMATGMPTCTRPPERLLVQTNASRPEFAGFQVVRLTSQTAFSLPGLDLHRLAYGSINQSIAV
jgi:hypothetical protein